MEKISWIARKDLDTEKWDQLVANSNLDLPYSLSWYLDAVAPQWGVFLVGDYSQGMAVPFAKKWGLPYAYQPPFCQQLGVLGKSIFPIEKFIKSLQNRFLITALNFNYTNEHSAFKSRINQVVVLQNQWTVIRENFSTNIKRGIKKAAQSGLQIQSEKTPNFEEFYLQHAARKDPYFSLKMDSLVYKLLAVLEEKKMANYFAVLDKDGSVCTVMMLVFYKKRWINIFSANNEKGRELKAKLFLINWILEKLISENEAGYTYFDFEGSSESGIHLFNKSFGATEQNFPSLKTRFLGF